MFRDDLVVRSAVWRGQIVSQAARLTELAQAIRIAATSRRLGFAAVRRLAITRHDLLSRRRLEIASSSLRQAMDLDQGGNAADWFLMSGDRQSSR